MFQVHLFELGFFEASFVTARLDGLPSGTHAEWLLA